MLRELLEMYAAESRLYREILELSRRQGELIGRGAGVSDLRSLLAEKRDRLDEIARLERRHADARSQWEAARSAGLGAAAAGLHVALREVGALIEQILELEERNDRLLLAETGA